MKSYISSPDKIKYSELAENNFRLAAKSQKRINLININYKTIKELLNSKPIPGKEVGSLSYVPFSNFKFLRTKAIQNNSYILDFDSVGTFEYIKPSDFYSCLGKESPKYISKLDLLFVTGGNVGAVAIADRDYHNVIYSSHIYKLPISKLKLYVFAFLKNNFCKEQANFSPEGSISGLDTFQIDYLLNIKIPFPNKNEQATIKFIEDLTLAIINKEQLIKERHKAILNLIESELLENQNSNIFHFELPKFKEIKEIGRIDTARYSYQYKRYEHLICNYKNGYFKLSQLGYTVNRGQNLQVSNIGDSFYSDIHIKGFYKLAVSSNYSEYSTVEKYSYLGNPNSLSEIQKGEIIFSARGAQFGRVVIFPEIIENTITNIDSLVIKNEEINIERNIFIAMFLNNLRWNKHIYKIAITGSGANSLTQYQSDDINFPNFPILKQAEIAKLYHNSQSNYKSKTFSLETFLNKDNDFNKDAGIYDLDKTAKQLKEILDECIDRIINNKEVEIKFYT